MYHELPSANKERGSRKKAARINASPPKKKNFKERLFSLVKRGFTRFALATLLSGANKARYVRKSCGGFRCEKGKKGLAVQEARATVAKT